MYLRLLGMTYKLENIYIFITKSIILNDLE